jgi:cytoskeletal protein RodZ
MDEELVETEVPSVGERLRAAREEKKMSLEDIAAQTRIPQRHLESLETSSWDKLPAPTYTIGFARSYATAVGLDRTEISDQLRTEMGGSRPAMAVPAEVFEPADPARTMPKWLVIGAVAAVVLIVVVMSWLNKRSLDQPDANAAAAEAPAAAPQAAPQAPPTVPQQVTVTATEPVWLQINEKGGAILYSAMMVPGQSFTVPPTATAPVLKTGKPEALRITVGNSVAPPVGRPATTVSNVSLLAADLMRGGQTPAAQPAPAARTPVARPRATSPARPRHSTASAAPAAPAPAPPSAAPSTNTTG